jgi:aminopeptidase N
VLLDAVSARQAGQAVTLDEGLRDAVRAVLADAGRDPAFAAEAMLLPSESLLAEAMEVVDPDVIHAVRGDMRALLGVALRDAFMAARETFGGTAADDVSGEAMARRAMRNAALGYLTAAGDDSLSAAQFAAASNMTDTLAALINLAEISTPARDQAFAAFYQKWRGNPLVLDKWFAVQARAGAADTLERVQGLTRHPDFDVKNPNRLRALIGAFTGNAAVFHEKAGAGYRLLADTIITVDALNAQIAARLTTALGNWRRYDGARQDLMRAQLERILAVPNLSSNSYEMASKALA